MAKPLIGPPGGRLSVDICLVLFDNLRIEVAKLLPGEVDRFNHLLTRTYGMMPEAAAELIAFLRK